MNESTHNTTSKEQEFNTPKGNELMNDRQFMFDDFDYCGSDDIKLAHFKWSLKEGVAGPGPVGCSWSKHNISFIDDPDSPDNRLMRLSASTDGTASGCSQAEILHETKYFEGTYAARVRFTDRPVSGEPGDKINETFFTISPLRYANDPLYSECDFEYLGNGGWEKAGATMWLTSWHTYQDYPDFKMDNTNNYINESHEGWHILVFVVAEDTVKYYIDGELKAVHGDKFYPRALMNISFNLWFLNEEDSLLPSGSKRTYVMDVDWVFHAKNYVMPTESILKQVNNFRNKGIKRWDSIM